MADEEQMQQEESTEQYRDENGGIEQAAVEQIDTQKQAGAEEDDDEDERKVFVGGLSWETTTKDLREYFEKYGEVTNCNLKTDYETKKSRGFGFVTFTSVDCVEKVIAEKEHKLHGRTIDPKLAHPRQGNKKVFVGRLDPQITEDEVKAYFEAFGEVEKLDLPFDKTKEQRRAFCFVEFKKPSSMKACLEKTNHKIGTQEVEVKKATPPGGNAVRGGPRGRGYGPTGGRGGRGGYAGGYGFNQNYGYGAYNQGYGGYDQYGYGGYGGYDQYGYGGGGYGQWNNGSGYDQTYYGSGAYGGQSNYGKAQKRGAAHGGYHPYNR
ncbi:heterogeneous nuclear ribonucleoprotein d-like [Plakobranchus ocellatus]|uniref:Heterogeneous nuclear ribonucleoprotein d-like n=1 Tax=Plakobranchus ocellatus TaxID=259542 RepID=A0AAV4DC97_9GAST|nr:heterogeneous nuclear ribonucleoprotein d-like [Plakobranchus ocellatus]